MSEENLGACHSNRQIAENKTSLVEIILITKRKQCLCLACERFPLLYFVCFVSAEVQYGVFSCVEEFSEVFVYIQIWPHA